MFPYSVIVALVITLIFAAFAGLLVNRSKEVYFLMLTLVLGQLVWAIVLQWVSLTKGTTGITGIELPHLWGLGQGSNIGFYYYSLTAFTLVTLGLTALMRSSFGLKLRGIRESESRMIMLGYNVALLKWVAFMISSFIAGLAGIFYVYYSGLINPDALSLNSSNQVMIASIFGGINSIIGAILGTGIIKTLEIVLSGVTQRYLLMIGILFLVVIMWLLFPSLSVEEHLVMAYRLAKTKDTEWTPERIYELFPEIAGRRKVSGTKLSGGEQQILAISRALVSNPQILMMDEPSEGISTMVIDRIIELCHKLTEQGVSILMVEQNLDLALRVAQRVYVLVNGRIVHEGTSTDFRLDKENQRQFLGV